MPTGLHRKVWAGCAFLGAGVLGSGLLVGCGSPNLSAVPGTEATSAPSTASATPSAVRDRELTDVQRRALLQSEATDDAGEQQCGPEQLGIRLGTLDVALGHRYSQLVVRNDSGQRCALQGSPGLGARGDAGSALTLDLQYRDPVEDGAAVTVVLEPGAEAYANLEWTGSLAGSDQEHLEVFVVQLAPDATPMAFWPPGEGAGHPANQQLPADQVYEWEDAGVHDLGEGTTVRIGPWRQ